MMISSSKSGSAPHGGLIPRPRCRTRFRGRRLPILWPRHGDFFVSCQVAEAYHFHFAPGFPRCTGGGGEGGDGLAESAFRLRLRQGAVPLAYGGGGPRSTRASTLDLACTDSADVIAIRCERNYRGETGPADALPRRPTCVCGESGRAGTAGPR